MHNKCRRIKELWFAQEANIFNNYIDATLGFFVLICLPFISIIMVLATITNVDIINYLFPIVSICSAAIYDTYGRYKQDSPRNTKLNIRLVINIIALCMSFVATILNKVPLTIISPLLLFISGMLVVHEILHRIKISILINW